MKSPWLKPARLVPVFILMAIFLEGLFVVNAAEQAAEKAAGKAADSTTATAPTSACANTTTLTHQAMLGDWQVIWHDMAQNGRLIDAVPEPIRFSANPEFPDSVSGVLQRGSERIQLAGDLEDGQLTLEESPDGKSIHATWQAELQSTSCGRLFTGTWVQDTSIKAAPATASKPSSSERRFTLKRVSTW